MSRVAGDARVGTDEQRAWFLPGIRYSELRQRLSIAALDIMDPSGQVRVRARWTDGWNAPTGPPQ